MSTDSDTTADPAPDVATAVATVAVGIALLVTAAWIIVGGDWLAGAVFAAWAKSTVAIAVDVRRLDADHWGSWPIWVVGAVVAYPITGPLYIYDRLQHPEHPLAGDAPAGTGIER